MGWLGFLVYSSSLLEAFPSEILSRMIPFSLIHPRNHWLARFWVGLVFLIPAMVGAQDAEPAGIQTIALRAGWNAVAIQVEPENAAPAAVFASLPVDKVATYFPSRTPVEFVQDPASQPWKQKGWRAWFAPALPESLVNDLYAINAGQCYLVHATAPATLTIRGTVVCRRLKWRADSFNFVGFPVDPANPPTFQKWFAGSSAHQPTKRAAVYSLDASDKWIPVVNPESTLIQPNTAYWVFCHGGSDYQGPLDVSTPFGVGTQLDYGNATETLSLRLANVGPAPLSLTLMLSPENALSLAYQQKLPNLGERLSVPLGASTALGSLEVGESKTLRVTLDRAALDRPSAAAVLTVRDDAGSLIQIPVMGKQP